MLAIFYQIFKHHSPTTTQTVSAMSSCVLALARHPDVQRRFQSEVDKFVAENNRLPTTTDRDDPAFAYVRAVISEVERFAPVAPIGEH